MARHLLVAALVLGIAGGFPWTASGDPATTEWTPLGRGVEHLALGSAGVGGHAFRFRPADVELRIVPAPEKRAFVSALAPAGDAIAANASFFDETGKPMGLAVDHGRSVGGTRLTRWAALIVDEGGARVVRGSQLATGSAGYRFAVQGMPRLVVGGAVPRLKPQRAERTAVCTTGAWLVLVVTPTRVDATAFARFLAAAPAAGGLGCEDALNLDGGSSTQLVAHWGGFHAEVDGRWGVPNALVVTPKPH